MIRPLGKYVLIKRDPLPERTRGGLFILGREWPAIGRVLAIGPKVRLDLAVGDDVTFEKFASENRRFGPDLDLLLLHADELHVRIRYEEQDATHL